MWERGREKVGERKSKNRGERIREKKKEERKSGLMRE